MKKLIFFLAAFFSLSRAFAVDASQLLPPEQAFVPQVKADKQGVTVEFKIADGYYLYRDKITVAAEPQTAFGDTQYAPGKEKEDEFFGKQTVYYHAAQAVFPYKAAPSGTYKLTVLYQGCADVGVCYPPNETTFEIDREGLHTVQSDSAADKPSNRFTAPKATLNEAEAVPPAPANKADSSRFKLSWDTLSANLLAFFTAGLGLSFTACMYPLIPIVSSIVVGDKNAGKGRAFALTMVYTQGLALTYTIRAAADNTTAGCCSQTVSSAPVSPAITPTMV